jgi:hypothetical protein
MLKDHSLWPHGRDVKAFLNILPVHDLTRSPCDYNHAFELTAANDWSKIRFDRKLPEGLSLQMITLRQTFFGDLLDLV